MTLLKITSLKEVNPFEGDPTIFPYTILNLTFKIDHSCEEGKSLWERAKGESQEYVRTLFIDDPEKYTDWILRSDFDFKESYPGYQWGFTDQEPAFQYIEKFDTFWFREWIAYSQLTQAIIRELREYQEDGAFSSKYRTISESVVLKHLDTLARYWD